MPSFVNIDALLYRHRCPGAQLVIEHIEGFALGKPQNIDLPFISTCYTLAYCEGVRLNAPTDGRFVKKEILGICFNLNRRIRVTDAYLNHLRETD